MPSSASSPRVILSPYRCSTNALPTTVLNNGSCCTEHSSLDGIELGRNFAASTKEAPSPPITVVPLQPALISRPGPVFGVDEGVFRAPVEGKYTHPSIPTLPEIISTSSATPAVAATSSEHSDSIPSSTSSLQESCSGSNVQYATHTSSPTPATRKLRIYYQNVRGLRTKIDDFFLAVGEEEYDVIVLTETWLNEVIYSPQLFGTSYTVFRTDRCPLNNRKSRGGGVLIAVSSRLNCIRESAAFSETLEQVWDWIDMSSYIISVGVLYLPPDLKGDLRIIQRHIDSIGSVHATLGPNDIALQFGDYNQSAIRWISPNGSPMIDLVRSQLSVASSALFDGFSFHGLSQINPVENPTSRILDLVLANDVARPNCTVSPADEPLATPVDVKHPPLVVDLSCMAPLTYELALDTNRYNFRKADYSALNEALLTVDWDRIDLSRTVDEAVDYFNVTISRMIAAHVPLVGPARKPAWSNHRLRLLKRRRSSALRRYCNYRSMYNKLQFNLASREYRNYNQFLYSRYIIRTQRNLQHNPKQFWSFVKSKRNEDGLPTSMFLGALSADTAAGKCTLFAEQFKTAFNNFVVLPSHAEDAARDTPREVLDFNIFHIAEEDVSKAIRKLKFSFSVGPDGIPSALLKRCCAALLEPLTWIYNLSFQSSTFPSSWKSSFLFPIHKKGNKCDVSKYRGITTLSACSKVFEIIVNDALFASCKHYITTDQHGFFPKRSVTTNLTQFISTCIKAVDAGKQVDAVYLDLKAAFDRVDHRILLAKLGKMGVSTAAVNWFSSYLMNRSLRVKIGSSFSESFTNTSGVPQGSNLGPLLFSLFINDVSLVLPPGVRLFYADDAKLYIVVNSLDDCIELQILLDCFEEWCARSRLTLSIEKCQVITYSRKRSPIMFDYSLSGNVLERVQRIRDLGVLLDDKLTFRIHFNDMISKANRQLGFMSKIANGFRDPHCLRSLYCALVRSILEFAVVVWCPYQRTWINRIETVQRKFVRFALRYLPWRNDQHLTPYEDRCQLLGLDTLEDRRRTIQAIFVAKILNSDIDSPALLAELNLYAPERHLRRRDMLRLGPRNSRYGQYDPVRFMSATFNDVAHLFDFNLPTSTIQREFEAHFRNAE